MTATAARACHFAAAIAKGPDPSATADDLARQLAESANAPDLLVLFVSAHHAQRAADIAERLRAALRPRTLIGVTTEAVIAAAEEAEGAPALSAFAVVCPGLEAHPFTHDDLPARPEQDPAALAEAMALDNDTRAVILFLDPFSTPTLNLLPAINAATQHATTNPPPVVGAMASAAAAPGQNRLILDDRATDRGLVGVTLAVPPSVPLRIDTLVSQGCRPIGPDMVITRARGNAILQLAGKPALQAIRNALEALDTEERQLLEQRGLFIGRVINEYKERFGRGDYLIRPVVGAEPNSGAVAIGDVVRPGQTIRLHLRDAETAHEDLALLLDGQKLHGTPDGVLLFTCNARGAKLFDTPSHDAAAITRAFTPPEAGERLAKPGAPFRETSTTPPSRRLPLAGCFAAGEIGPIGGQTFLHGHTASLAIFRTQ